MRSRCVLLGSFVALSLVSLAALAQDTAKGEFPLATSPVKRFGANQLRHGSRIQCLLFAPKGAFAAAPDESLLIAGGGNDPVRIWNPATGQRVRTVDVPWVQALAWNPKGKSFVVGSVFRNFRVVGVANDEPVVGVHKHDAAPAAIKCLAIGPDGKPILAGCQDGQLLMYFPSNQKAVHVLAHKGEVNALAAAPANKSYASGGGDRTIVVWRISPETETLDKVKTFIAPGMVHALAFTPDGDTLISAGDDRAIRLWDLNTGRIAHSLEGHKDTVVNLALSTDGKTLVSTSHDETAIVWDLAKREKRHVIPLRFGDVDALALSPDAKLIAVAGGNNVIRLFETETGKERIVAPGPQTSLVKITYLPAADKIATLSAAGELQQWDAKTAALGKSWPIKVTPLVQQDLLLVASPDSSMLLTGSSAHADVELWDNAGKPLGSLTLPAKESLASAAFNGNGKSVALGFRSGLVQLVDWPGRDVRVTAKAAGPVQRLAFCREAPVFATASGGKIEIWDAPTGQPLRHFFAKDDVPENQQPAVADLAFSPDGKTIAVSGYDGIIRLCDWTTGKFLAACEGHSSAAPSIAFSPDGRTLASASFDKTVRLWETFTGKPIETFKDHDGPVACVTFAPNGRTLYSAGADTRALAWDPPALIVDNPQNAKIDPAKLQGLWSALAAENGHVGQGATWRLVAAPKDAAPFLASQIYLLDPKKVDQLFRELDAKEFPIREKATQELEKYGRWMEGRLETALKDPPSLEVKRRLERMLSLLRTGGSASLRQERLRTLRVLQILEQIADQPSMKVLDDLARGAAEPELQREAELALKRLQKRAG